MPDDGQRVVSWVRSNAAGISSTEDSGVTWSPPAFALTGTICPMELGAAIVCSSKKAVCVTEDFGKNWKLLPSLRSSKDQGQSNFVNPGLLLAGLGGDFDLAPRWRLLANVSKLSFADTSSLEFLRNQGAIDRNIGVDVSAGLQFRPFMTQNVVFNASLAALLPGRGFRQLYDEHRGPQYSLLVNLLLNF